MATKKKDSLNGLDLSKPEDQLTYIRIEAVGPIGTEDPYAVAVEAVATILRPRFESGELHGWDDETAKRMEGTSGREYVPPVWRLGRACTRMFIRTPEAALLVLRSATKDPGREPWVWNRAGEGQCLLGEAEEAMAQDVLAFARVAGWSRPTSGEEVAPMAMRRAKRAHGRQEGARSAAKVA